MTSQYDTMRERAEEWLEVAQGAIEEDFVHAAYECARTAAELAAKAMLLRIAGTYPKRHDVSDDLRQHALLPDNIKARDLRALLQSFTLAVYLFNDPVTKRQARDAVRIARRLVESLG